MLDANNLLAQYLNNTESDNEHLFEYFKTYQLVVDRFGYEPIIQPGRIQLLGWDLEYLCGANLSGQIDATLIRRQNNFIPENERSLILDCGANIGITVLNYKRQFPRARVIAFEADPEFAPVLHRNLERNGASDVEVVDAAVWIENGTSEWRSEGIDGSHLSVGIGETAKTSTVRTVDLGDYLNEPVDLIKMDIEGAEYEVINHVGKKLKNVKAMSIECHIKQTTIIPFGKLLRILSIAGFQISINSYGPWCDLIRQVPILPDHHENYVLVSAWRGSIPAAFTHSSWIPKAGAGPIRDYANMIQFVSAREADLVRAASAREAELMNYLNSYSSSGVDTLKRTVLKKPYQKEDGLSWSIQLGNLKGLADDMEHPNRSTLLLYEDDKLLQPAHALHEDIRRLGGGRYSHWSEALHFSTSDGSDPNINGREYRIIYIA